MISLSTWRIFFSISYSVYLIIIHLSFHLLIMYLFDSNFLMSSVDTESGLTVFWHFKMIFHCLLYYTVSNEKSSIICIVVLVYFLICPPLILCPWLLSRFLAYYRFFSSFAVMCFRVIFFEFIQLQDNWNSWTNNLMLFFKPVEISAVVSLYF